MPTPDDPAALVGLPAKRHWIMEAWLTGTRARALRHALRYRRQARHARELATLATHYSEANAVDAVAALERVAALEAAIEEALKRGSAGCRDWRKALEGVRRA